VIKIKNRVIGFHHWYTTTKTKHKDLPQAIYKTEKEVREEAKKEYVEPMVELRTVNKVGFRKYLIVWKVTGKFI